MRCPRCTGQELQLGIILSGTVICRFRDGRPLEVIEASAFDSFWDPQASCECCACRWIGPVAAATEGVTESRQIAEFDSTEYHAVALEFSAGASPRI